MSVTYKLHYFPLRGRGEIIRLIFAYQGQKYEDYRIKWSNWPEYKKLMPVGKVPVLEINDGVNTTLLAETKAIGRYLANKFGIAGQKELDKAKVDEIVDKISDEMDILTHVNLEKDADLKIKQFDEYLNVTLPLYARYYEDILTKNKSGFLVGDSLTWADLALMNKWDFLSDSRDDIFEKFNIVKQHYHKVRQMPRIDEWLRVRPVSRL